MVNCSICNNDLKGGVFTNYPMICEACRNDLEEMKRTIGVGGVEAFKKWWGELKW